MATAKKAAPAKTPAPKAPTATKVPVTAAPVKPVEAKPATTTPAAPKAAAPKAPAAKPAKPVKPAKAAKVIKVVKVEKPKKPKLVRDSYTIPKAEYTVLDDLKLRALKLGSHTKKSELLRAGIKALAAMSDVAFQAALGAVPAIKTGRPKAD